jgi:hypothetical protein
MLEHLLNIEKKDRERAEGGGGERLNREIE